MVYMHLMCTERGSPTIETLSKYMTFSSCLEAPWPKHCQSIYPVLLAYPVCKIAFMNNLTKRKCTPWIWVCLSIYIIFYFQPFKFFLIHKLVFLFHQYLFCTLSSLTMKVMWLCIVVSVVNRAWQLAPTSLYDGDSQAVGTEFVQQQDWWSLIITAGARKSCHFHGGLEDCCHGHETVTWPFLHLQGKLTSIFQSPFFWFKV